MKKIRCFLATSALIVTLGGLSLLQGMGAGALANATTHAQVSSVHASSIAYRHYGPCPGGGTNDC
jgi:hypothetical protein